MSSSSPASPSPSIRLLINGGDNMLGRGVQLSGQHQAPGDAALTDSMPAEWYLRSSLHPGEGDGDIPLDQIRHLNRSGRYLWGDYIGMKISPPPDLRLLNLETAVSRGIDNDDAPKSKGIRYHLHSDNVGELLSAYAGEQHGGDEAIPVVLCMANNHVMDMGRQAFELEMETTLRPPWNVVGVGLDVNAATAPFELDIDRERAIEVIALATECSGTPVSWAATERRSGVWWLPALISTEAVDGAISFVATRLSRRSRPPRPVRVVSIHWGPNWAYRYGDDDGQAFRRLFARRLIDECSVDLIYGHSSHHIRGLELHRSRLIMYGAGDLVNDYEGFANRGDENYPKFGALFVLDLFPSGALRRLCLIPMFMDRLRLRRLRRASTIWDPTTGARRSARHGAGALCEFVNGLSVVDAGGAGAAVELVVDVDEKGDEVLVFDAVEGDARRHRHQQGTAVS